MAGLGCDIAQISRFGGLVRRWGSRFLERAYSQQEINQYYSICANCEHRGVVFLASRWAVKEATIKAFNKRLLFPEIVVLSDSSGLPRVDLIGEAGSEAKHKKVLSILATISHDGDYAMAVVLLKTHL